MRKKILEMSAKQRKDTKMIMFPTGTLTSNAACKRANRRGYPTTRSGSKITVYDHGKKNVLLKDASADEVIDWLARPLGAEPTPGEIDD